jgi:hypothetical protein
MNSGDFYTIITLKVTQKLPHEKNEAHTSWLIGRDKKRATEGVETNLKNATFTGGRSAS